MIEIDNRECERKQIMDKIYTFCVQNYLKFNDDPMFRFVFRIMGITPRKTKGFIDEILNGGYDNVILCDCQIYEDGKLYINFHKKASELFMKNLLDMVDDEGINTVVRKPCDV